MQWALIIIAIIEGGSMYGSGSVESAHKQVVQRRLKQAGMRWAPQHVNPILALRDLLCNGRWSEGWNASSASESAG